MALVYACNPLSIAVVAVHCQFDAVPLLLLTTSLALLRRGAASSRTIVVAGVLFGCAVLEKPWPAVLLPLAVLSLGRWRLQRIFLASSAAVIVITAAFYCALIGVGPQSMIVPVVRYGGVVGNWGLSLLATLFCKDGGCSDPIAVWAMAHGKLLLVVAKGVFACLLIAVSFLASAMPLEMGCTMVLLAFYVLTYGWGYNYLMWILPFLLLAEPAARSGAYLVVATLTTLLMMYGYGGVYFAFLQHFALTSPVWRYGGAVSLPLWVLCGILLLGELLWRARCVAK